MTIYTAPIREMEFVLNEIADLPAIAELPGYEEATEDLVSAILEESGKFSTELLAPINQQGDIQGSKLQDGKVITPDGWKEAYTAYVEGGWGTLTFSEDDGGQGLPKILSVAVHEMWDSANTAFSLCPMLTQGAINALLSHGTQELKDLLIPKLITGEWSGTMNLTEPQAGSDLSAVRTKAVPEGEHYLITGQKIFITYGDQDLTENIIHLVLARVPGAPEGVKGISLFLVPKVKLDSDGNLLDQNDVVCTSLEHKMGIHGSPTAVLSFGDNGGAEGYLVGEENKGLIYMFTMMNAARLAVGLEGLGLAERAYQQARDYAKERVQGQPIGIPGDKTAIIEHPDVRRMLMTMKSQIEAMRCLAYYTNGLLDKASHSTDKEVGKKYYSLTELLTPVVKGWCTETAVDVTSIGVQIHGGVGYIEETGAAQHLRDARITPIYEGTTAIQANALLGRKILHDKGETMQGLIESMQALSAGLTHENLAVIRDNLNTGIEQLSHGVDWVLKAQEENPRLPAAASVLLLELTGIVTAGWLMAKSAKVAQEKLDSNDSEASFYSAKVVTADFYARHIMPRSHGLIAAILHGSEATLAFELDQF
ncbi:MAG: acyl-CoA dehydrogenase [Methylococcales bacterium]